jgi:curved DNA-binding protein CbpA
MALRDLLAISGMNESEALGIIYSLALAGLVKRENWKTVLGEGQPGAPNATQETPVRTAKREPARQAEDDVNEIENFLERVKNAQTFYDVLAVDFDVPQENLKIVYYQLARLYHPDRFRKAEPELLSRIESTFARITQAYETLRDEGLRAAYNAKLAARRKVEKLSDSAPKAAPSQSEQTKAPAGEAVVSEAERAETQFKEGFAALELGQRKVAMGLFASAAGAVPTEARYRAFYGHVLAGNESTRRQAETELAAAIKLDPGNAEYRVMLAELYRDLGLKLRAKGEAERAVKADPNNRKARDLLRALK